MTDAILDTTMTRRLNHCHYPMSWQWLSLF